MARPLNTDGSRDRFFFGTSLELVRMGELEPEDARWMMRPWSAWSTIKTNASAALCHCNTHGHYGNDVSGYRLAAFMDDVLGTQWHTTPVQDELILRTQLEHMHREIEAGRWVVLGWQPHTKWPVEWKEDPAQKEAGQWQVSSRSWQSGERIHHALQSRLDEVYRLRRLRVIPAGAAPEPFVVPRHATSQPVSLRSVPTLRPIGIAPALTKAQRWQTRKALIAAGRTTFDGHVRAAAERLARNNVAVEKARLSDHVYEPSRPVPEGWANRSGDAKFLARYRLKMRDLEINGSNFGAQVYEPDAAVFGADMNPTLAFKGTDDKLGRLVEQRQPKFEYRIGILRTSRKERHQAT